MQFKYTAIILASITAFVFIVQNLFSGFTESFYLLSADVFTRPWILLTSIFLHGSLYHLLSNLFALVLFGSILEKIIGYKRFLFVFFVTGILSSILSIPFYSAALGASGAIFGILGTLGAIKPKMIVWNMGVPMPMAAAVLVWFILDVAGTFHPTGIANMAHIAGLLAGIVIGLFMKNNFPESQNKKHNMLSEEDIDKWEEEWM